ncbi:MAG: bifunctional oligoribonuclease/PAP phosphatase NrnA [Deltaproteobacteria bacterium]|jgi:phosphoesterase RecJ-like protein|nr:bifunctional oligoribonuclease/PAP phosphatase NrnA [Deltaproteobacteria bacterium]
MTRGAKERGGVEPSRVFLELLTKNESFLILGHQHPDGDALGSAAALAAVLRAMGKNAEVGISGRITPNITFLMDPPKYFTMVTDMDFRYLKSFELIIYVDCHGPSRVWPDSDPDLWSELPPNLVIDHHIHNEELQGALAVYHDRHASSTGELIMRLLRGLEVKPASKAVEAILTAIVSDTGFFTQDNTTPLTLREAAELVEHGGKLARLHEALNCGHSIARMRLLSKALGSLELFLEGKVAVMLLSSAMLEEAGARMEEADGFIEYPRSISGVLLSALIKEDMLGGIKVSLRSKPPVCARMIAQRFGGGGHDLAAAYTDHVENIEHARDRFLEVAAQYMLGD